MPRYLAGGMEDKIYHKLLKTETGFKLLFLQTQIQRA